MARNLNSEGKLILSDLSMDEKTDIILEIWSFLEGVNDAFTSEFYDDYFDDEEDEDFAEAVEKLGQDYIWTDQGNNNDIVAFQGLDVHVWGSACVPGYISSEEDWDSRVRGWVVSKTSRSNAKGLFRDLYAKANPDNQDLPLSDYEKEHSWNNAPYVWFRAYVKCPFCEPLDDQSPVECPVNESRLYHLSEEHEFTQSYSAEDGF